jgi:hypothetical protein
MSSAFALTVDGAGSEYEDEIARANALERCEALEEKLDKLSVACFSARKWMLILGGRGDGRGGGAPLN